MSLPYEQCRPSEPCSLRIWIKHQILTTPSPISLYNLPKSTKIWCSCIEEMCYNQLSMRNNSFHPAESIQSGWGHPFLAGHVCVAGVRSPARARGRGARRGCSRSKLRPAASVRAASARSVRAAVNSPALWNHSAHNETQVGVRSMRAFKKSIQSPLRLYLWRKFSLFTNVGGSNWACYCTIVSEAWLKENVLLCAPFVRLASLLLSDKGFPPNL